VAAFSGFSIGSRLILTCHAGELNSGDEVEVVKMLGPSESTTDFPLYEQDDGIRVQKVVDNKPSGRDFEFVWECGARYFK